MNSFIRMLMQLALGVLVTLPLTACAATVSSKALEGKVFDEGANQPVANAIVIVRWIGDIGGIGHGSSVCYHVEVVTANNQGEFHIPAWSKPSPYGDIAHQHFARYAYALSHAFVRVDKEVIYLQPFAGGREERLEYLKHVSSATGCSDKKEIERNLLPLYRALYEEAKGIAVTKEDREKVETLLFGLESIEFGSMEALNRMTERRKMQK